MSRTARKVPAGKFYRIARYHNNHNNHNNKSRGKFAISALREVRP